jgi:hypothetical protein
VLAQGTDPIAVDDDVCREDPVGGGHGSVRDHSPESRRGHPLAHAFPPHPAVLITKLEAAGPFLFVPIQF